MPSLTHHFRLRFSSRGLCLAVGFWLVGTLAGCSFDSGLDGVSCEEEGATSQGRVCESGYWVRRDAAPLDTSLTDTTTDTDTDGGECVAKTETCNEVDDDCDGVVDEGCPCDVDGTSEGVCQRGVIQGDGTCKPPEGYVAEEGADECDMKDNDCDGEVDEGCDCEPGETEPCYTGDATTEGTGPCRGGMRTCGMDHRWGACEGETTPVEEVCDDAVDNDCDGEINEECTCDYQGKSEGVCAGAGVDAMGNCTEPSGFEAATEAESACDQKDNDCDGHTDEGCACSYNQKSTGVCAGQVRGSDGSCPKPADFEAPTDEEMHCDRKDNDCDGTADEGCDCQSDESRTCYTGAMGTKGVGECEAGTQTCGGGGSWESCKGQTLPEKEMCGDDKDNDCDGVVDENCPCDYKQKAEGVCKGLMSDTQGNCPQPADWMADTGDETPNCDTLDNDCDGEVDEGCVCVPPKTEGCYTGPTGTKGDGVCKGGMRSCTSMGTWGGCMGEVTPSMETCDGMDNDCDEVVDEGCSCNYDMTAKGVCKGQTIDMSGTCTEPMDYLDPSKKEKDEWCDGKDNDCDGNTDEDDCDCVNGDTRDCYGGPMGTAGTGICQKGTETCVDGEWDGCMNQVQPQNEESCDDNRDENCNGADSDGCECDYKGNDAGVCKDLTVNLKDNCPEPNGWEATEQSCGDNQDNDCDGQTDYEDINCKQNAGASCSDDDECLGGCHGGTCGHVIFVTSTDWQGDLGGLSGADTKCQDRANAAGLNGTWKAVLSDNKSGGSNAKDRLTFRQGVKVYNLNGDELAQNPKNLWNGKIENAVEYTENVQSRQVDVWTGTKTDGTADFFECYDWTSDRLGSGQEGNSGKSGGGWIEDGRQESCRDSYALYCVDGQ